MKDMFTNEDGYIKKKWMRLFPILIIVGTVIGYAFWYTTFMADIVKI